VVQNWPFITSSTEHLWNRKLASLVSSVLSEIFMLKSDRSWRADVLHYFFSGILVHGFSPEEFYASLTW